MAQRVARSAAQILSAPAAAPVASKSLAEAQQRARYFFREVRAWRSARGVGRCAAGGETARFVPAPPAPRAALAWRPADETRSPGRVCCLGLAGAPALRARRALRALTARVRALG